MTNLPPFLGSKAFSNQDSRAIFRDAIESTAEIS